MATAITFTVSYVGSPSADDIIAARHIVFVENQRRLAQAPPLAVLPTATGPELKASYLTILLATVTGAHDDYMRQAKDSLQIRFTPVELETIRTNLITRLNAGESAATLIADTAA